jgi:hypothetical protein
MCCLHWIVAVAAAYVHINCVQTSSDLLSGTTLCMPKLINQVIDLVSSSQLHFRSSVFVWDCAISCEAFLILTLMTLVLRLLSGQTKSCSKHQSNPWQHLQFS